MILYQVVKLCFVCVDHAVRQLVNYHWNSEEEEIEEENGEENTEDNQPLEG